MAIFRRKPEEGSVAPATDDALSALPPPGPLNALPTGRDPELAVPPFRPAPKETPMSLAPKPSVGPAGGAVPPAAVPRPAGAPVGARPAPRPEPAERRTLVVGKGISLQGTVADAERLVVEGTVESQMIHAAELSISHSGVFKGEVEVEEAEIAGFFDGTLTARTSLVIRSTGRISGVARCKRLQVEEGGQVSGRMEMLTDQANATPAMPTAMPVRPRPADAPDA
ncbi:polymer-forming cytoskeletal protein [Roseomonas sp. NAR14]|uniref:Polymer-forming cytoskeletal protein n=2 Tax=Roseomonas acroporae TaxID=2937791 RepID=A0A9X1Y4B4_9PROT|nr:polymer-forming cytoskeletal protein [Roseomonas acroporae]MCK8782887.1 polymer-forming cytoskeletal protein [Roseomonas acroporae]